jgi:hypothetical protein
MRDERGTGRTKVGLAVVFCHTAVMCGRARIGCPYQSGGRVAWLLLWGFFFWGIGAVSAEAQDEPKAVEDAGVPTLHVYTNLIQIPTLVLGSSHELIQKPIAENRFSLSIDDGPWFRATHVRQEGDDPIELSILLDLSGDAALLMPKIGDALSELARSSLRPRDRVSVYALDCSLIRSLYDAPADSGSIKKATDAALESWTLRKKHKESCEQGLHLWDGLANVEEDIARLPGRRVILAVTDGQDKGSKHTPDQVTTFAQQTGTAIFGLNYAEVRPLGVPMMNRHGAGMYVPGDGGLPEGHAALIPVCELSGGVVTTTSEKRSVELALRDFVTMLRERYIVEFPRPSNSTAGSHLMQVKVANGNYFIRSSGILFPIPDPALAADPTTIQSGPSRAPEQGTRKGTATPK